MLKRYEISLAVSPNRVTELARAVGITLAPEDAARWLQLYGARLHQPTQVELERIVQDSLRTTLTGSKWVSVSGKEQ